MEEAQEGRMQAGWREGRGGRWTLLALEMAQTREAGRLRARRPLFDRKQRSSGAGARDADSRGTPVKQGGRRGPRESEGGPNPPDPVALGLWRPAASNKAMEAVVV